jgi:bifunctional non-homologous end joining protein LigD
MPNKLTKVEFTNLKKIIYPMDKITKAQVIEYYIRMAPKILKLLVNRPLSLTRFPNGIDKKGFFEKNAPVGIPNWVKTMRKYSKTAQRDIDYILCNNLETLIWLANLAALEIHITLSKTEKFESPDLIFIDVDPEPPIKFDDVIKVVLLIKEKLDNLGLLSFVKTSGKKGFHVLIPISKGYTFNQTKDFVRYIGKSLSRESEIIVSEFSQSQDPGTIFIDYLQNSHGRTMVCPYSLRATPSATVSTPLDWKYIGKGLKPEDYNIFTVQTIKQSPWQGLLKNKQKLKVD